MFDSVDILFYVLPYQIHPYQSHEMGTCLSNLPVFSLFPKTWFQLRRDVNFPLPCHILVCNICKSLKTLKAARTLPAEFGYWLLHFAPQHDHIQSQEEICPTPTVRHTVTLRRMTKPRNSPQISSPFCEATCISGLSSFMGRLLTKGETMPAQVSQLCFGLYAWVAGGSRKMQLWH